VKGRSHFYRVALLPLFLIAASACQQQAVALERAVDAPVAAVKAMESPGLKKAVFAGGCFWGVEAVFSHVEGVTSAVSGYHGGTGADASYDLVSTGVTRHAEAVKVVYDPEVVRYDQLLRIFFSVVADPTLKNRQGPDVGPQYRAALVPLGAEQKKVVAAYLAQMQRSGLWDAPIVTRIEAYRGFHPAEGYHQDFMANNPSHPYIRKWDAPKVSGLARLYPEHYRKAFKRG
jgi:peptide-methionine (S)-S-oxide reductase